MVAQPFSDRPTALELEIPKLQEDAFLGDIQVIDALVRTFIAGVCGRHAAAGEGASSREEAIAGDRAACEEMGKILAGQDDRYVPLSPWHTGGELAAYVKATLAANNYRIVDTDPADVLAAACMILLQDVYKAIQMSLDNAADAEVRDRIDSLIEDYTHLFMGLPFPE